MRVRRADHMFFAALEYTGTTADTGVFVTRLPVAGSTYPRSPAPSERGVLIHADLENTLIVDLGMLRVGARRHH